MKRFWNNLHQSQKIAKPNNLKVFVNRKNRVSKQDSPSQLISPILEGVKISIIELGVYIETRLQSKYFIHFIISH